MADPTLTVEIAFTTDPWSTPTWTDVSTYAESVSVRRGKARVLDNQQAGTCSVTLDNSDGRFDPSNASGPYYPNVLPMRRIRIRATYSATVYGLFSGFIESWPQPYGGIALAHTSISGVDAFKVLNLQKVTATYSQELSSDRVTDVLDDLGWPAADRSIDTGNTTVQASTLAADNPLSHLLTVGESENGLLYIDRDGKLRLISRGNLVGGLLDTTNYTFGEAPSEKTYEDDVVVTYDDADIWNEISVSSQGVTTQVSSDATSQAQYLKRDLSKTGLLLTSTTEQKAYADFLLASYKDPALRVDRITFKTPTSFWDRVLDRDLGAKVLVNRDPPGGGSISQPSYVEGIQWDIDENEWRCSWNLAATSRRARAWVLGDLIDGVLGSTTRLAY